VAVKVLLQRVRRAQVTVDDEVIGAIDRGLVVFVGIECGDSEAEVDYFVDRTAGLRLFDDREGRMNCSLLQIGGEALVVSQFTLAASTRRGRRPSFTRAAPPSVAAPLYRRFVDQLGARGVRVASGRFQATMQVELVNDGPVTILLDPGSVGDEV
jgi:D-tyrosyl-tRNA(Tyr) deacylase